MCFLAMHIEEEKHSPENQILNIKAARQGAPEYFSKQAHQQTTAGKEQHPV